MEPQVAFCLKAHFQICFNTTLLKGMPYILKQIYIFQISF